MSRQDPLEPDDTLAQAARGIRAREDRAEALRTASRASEEEQQDRYDDMRKDADDDARTEHEETE